MQISTLNSPLLLEGVNISSLISLMKFFTRILEMTQENNFIQDSTLLLATERIRMKHKNFRVIAYKLPNGQTAITVRQMAVAVQKPSKNAKEFLRITGVRPWKVQMPNRCITDMISLSTVAAYWKHLNESGKGNIQTRLGQQLLIDYLANQANHLTEGS
ncbi:hypothetical protein [Fischerella thermalis]